eukprot:2923074-Pleurochrysis_carterae.AAC.1
MNNYHTGLFPCLDSLARVVDVAASEIVIAVCGVMIHGALIYLATARIILHCNNPAVPCAPLRGSRRPPWPVLLCGDAADAKRKGAQCEAARRGLQFVNHRHHTASGD